jgi:2-isopropylmalate synthase
LEIDRHARQRDTSFSGTLKRAGLSKVAFEQQSVREKDMVRELKEEFFRLDGAWASFELMSIRKRDDYLKPFRVLRCKIDDQVDFRASESLRSTTEASLLIEMFGAEELVAATGRGPVHAVDNAMRKVLEKHYPQLAEVRLVEFDVRLLHGTVESEEEYGAAALVRVLGIFTDDRDRWGTVGVAADILQASIECIIDGLEWKLRGEQKH